MGDFENIDLDLSAEEPMVPVKATKASGNVTEDAIESLQVFVFGKDGQVQSSGIAEENSLTLTCTTGEKQIAAVVNASTLSGVNTLEQLQAKMSDFGDNTLGGFVMSGLKPETLSASGSVTVPVSRLVSKVKLSSVTNSFRLSQHQAMEFELMSMFLTNAPQQTGYFNATQSSQMINDGTTDIDDIVVFLKNGKYIVTKVTDKAFVGKNIIHAGVFIKNDSRTIYNAVYRDGKAGIVYVKRFAIMGVTRDKEYDITQGKPDSQLLWFSANPNGEAEVLKVFLKPRPKLKKLIFDFDFASIAVKGRASMGNILSKNPIHKVQLKSKGVSTKYTKLG